jgi:hypothetical protein
MKRVFVGIYSKNQSLTNNSTIIHSKKKKKERERERERELAYIGIQCIIFFKKMIIKFKLVRKAFQLFLSCKESISITFFL